MEQFLHGSGHRRRIEMEEFRPDRAQLFLYNRRNCTDGVIARDLHREVRQTCANTVHAVPASLRMLLMPASVRMLLDCGSEIVT